MLHLCGVIALNVPVCRWYLPVSEMRHHCTSPGVEAPQTHGPLCTEASSLCFSLFLHRSLQVGRTQIFSAESQEMHCWKNFCPGSGSSDLEGLSIPNYCNSMWFKAWKHALNQIAGGKLCKTPCHSLGLLIKTSILFIMNLQARY